MKLQRLFGALCAGLVLISLPVKAAEQSSYVTPVAGPMNMATFAGTYLNPALRSLASCSWGSSAPINGPSGAALPYQCWADTTANPVVFKFYDGASWVVAGKLNTSTHAWTPSRQGTDLGTAAIATTGTSGHTIPFLDGTNTWSAAQTFGAVNLTGTFNGNGNPLNNVVIGASTPLAGSFTTLNATTGDFATGAQTHAQIKQWAGDLSYNAFSLNGTVTSAGMIGIMGGNAADTNMFYMVPSTGGHHFRVNNAETAVLDATKLALNQSTASTSTTTGALTTPGGVGIGGAINAGGAINKVTITPPATGSTLTIPDGVTLTGPAASGTAMTLGNAETVTGVKTFGTPIAIGSGGTGSATAATARTALGVAIGSNVQAWDADLDALAANATAGFWAYTGAGTGAARTLTAPAAGITITNPAGAAGNPTFALANDLAALEGLSSTGIARRTGTDAWSVGTAVANSELATAADGTIKSNISGSTATPSDNTITAVLDKLGSTQGSVLYRNATAWVPLTPGTAGQFLTTQGTAANPNWSSGGAGTGTVTQVVCGTGLTGGTITASGTCALSTPVSVANGGTGDTGTAWSSFTASPSCGTASITTNSSKAKVVGKTTNFQVDFTITSLGSCTNALTFTLPNTANSGGGGVGRDVAVTGAAFACSIIGATTSASCFTAGANFLVSQRVIASGVYENQ